MEKIHREVDNSRRRIETLTDILRFVWVSCFLTAMTALIYRHFTIAALTASLWVISLLMTAVARRRLRHLVPNAELVYVEEFRGYRQPV